MSNPKGRGATAVDQRGTEERSRNRRWTQVIMRTPPPDPSRAVSHHVVGMNRATKPRPSAVRSSQRRGRPQLVFGQEERQAPQSAHVHPHPTPPIPSGLSSHTAATASPLVSYRAAVVLGWYIGGVRAPFQQDVSLSEWNHGKVEKSGCVGGS